MSFKWGDVRVKHEDMHGILQVGMTHVWHAENIK